MKHHSQAKRLHGSTAWGLALSFLFLELLKAHRSSQWSGVLLHDWLAIGLASVAYAAVFHVLLRLGDRLARRLPGGAEAAWCWRGALVSVAGAVVWAALSVHREFTPTLDDAIVVAVLVASGVGLALGGGRGWWSSGRFGALLVLAWLAGVAALVAAGDYFLFRANRADLVTFYPGLWLAVVGLLLLMAAYARFHRGFIVIGLIGFLGPPALVQALLYAPARNTGTDQPNMVFLIADTLRADYCSAYGGHVPTPNLTRLAESGTRFDRHYALAPWTLPSMTGLFSSQYPQSLTPDAGHEVWTLEMNRYAVDYEEPTLPMRLEAAGYTTGAFTANAFLPVIPGMMFGYQERASSHPILLRDEGYFRQLPFLGALVKAWLPFLANIRPHNTTIDLDHYARAFIDRHRDKPFFLWIHYIDPHAPYDPPESLRRKTDGPWPFFHPYIGGEQWGIPILGRDFSVAEEHRDYVQSLYEGEVAYIDAFTGRVMDALAAAGIGENTYFCFTSDHGEELWDHGAWGHGQSLYDELMRVPLIMAGPDIEKRVEPAPVSAIDLIPTLADLLGVPASPSWRGTSVASALRGDGPLEASPVFALGTSNKAPANPMFMQVDGPYKLVETAGDTAPALYNLDADAAEQNDIAAKHPDRVEAMQARIRTWLDSFPAFFEDDPDNAPEFNRALEEGLEGMGYL